MTDKMRELFEAKFPVPEGVAWKDSGNYGVVGKGTRAMLSASSYRAMWQAWQAAQSAAVPVVGNGMLEKFKTWKDERIGRHALIEPLEWFAGGYACAESSHAKSVPVVGDVEALICDDCGAETNDPWHSSKGTNRHYHRCDSCYSIHAAELYALRRDAERYRWIRACTWEKSSLCAVGNPKEAVRLGYDCPSYARLDEAIDAAIAGEKKAAATYAGPSSTACDDQLSAGVGEDM